MGLCWTHLPTITIIMYNVIDGLTLAPVPSLRTHIYAVRFTDVPTYQPEI